MSLPERLLWRELKQRPEGFKFRRQHPAGRYVLDFYCYEARLCIEVDGDWHGLGDQPGKDAERDAWMAMQGIATLRLTAVDLLNNIEGCVEAIVNAAQTQTFLRSSTSVLPPSMT